MPNIPLLVFNSGELSPKVDARSDFEPLVVYIDKYSAGCRTLENMIPTIYGPAVKRPGTIFVKEAKFSPQGIRLFPFIFNSEIAYICEFGDLYARFYFSQAILLDGDSNVVEVVTPYLVTDLKEIQFKQLADTMWLVHKSYAPYKLTRPTATSFSLDKIVFNKGPFRLRNDLLNDDDVTMQTDVTAVDATGFLTASSAVFEDPGHVGALFKLTYPAVSTAISIKKTGSSISDATDLLDILKVKGEFKFRTHGRWTATVKLQRRENSDLDTDWEDARVLVGVNDYNDRYTDIEEEDNVEYRINITSHTSGPVTVEMEVKAASREGVVRIDSIFNSTIADITVISEIAIADTTTYKWSEGSWSNKRGFPETLTFFENRAIYARDREIWISESGDFEDFEEGIKDADSFVIPLMTTNEARWIEALESLVLGTSGNEFRIFANKLDTPLTPTNWTSRQHSQYGSASLQALRVNSVILFVDFVGRKIREFTWSDSEQKYVAPDLTALAEHITETGITAYDHQKNPDSIVWCTRTDGIVPAMVYEREQNVVAWSRHLFNPSVVDTSQSNWYISGPSHYPILRSLTSGEIPTIPTEPTPTAQSTPTEIANATDLQNISNDVTDDYILTADIDLDGVGWTPLVAFSGTFNGAGFKVSNLTLSASADNKGLFATVDDGAEIYDVTIDNFTITMTSAVDRIGCLIGSCVDNAGGSALLLKNITITNSTITSSGATTRVGILAGELESQHGTEIYECNVSNCLIDTENTSNKIGGLIGFIDCSIASPTLDTNITLCAVSGMVIEGVTASSIGGMCGIILGPGTTAASPFLNIHTCRISVGIVATAFNSSSCGGLIGGIDNTVTITTSFSLGTITITTTAVSSGIGGFVGNESTYSTYINCFSEVVINITTTQRISSVGGFIGFCDMTELSHQLKCSCNGNITITQNGNAKGISKIGGYIGATNDFGTPTGTSGLIERCTSHSDIDIRFGSSTLPDQIEGCGFIGQVIIDQVLPMTIRNCYSWGRIEVDVDITGKSSSAIGGFITSIDLVTANTLIVANCYSAQTDDKFGSTFLTDKLEPANTINGLMAVLENQATNLVTNSFYDQTTSGTTTSLYGDNHITPWMMRKARFEAAGWDFDDIWLMDEQIIALSAPAVGTVDSIARIPSTSEDEIWISVLVNIDSIPRRYICVMSSRDFGSDLDDAFFVDCGITYDSTAISTITGLDHLEGETVKVLADGVVFDDATVSAGSITLKLDGTTTTASTVQVGLGYTAKLVPMRPDISGPGGTTQGSIVTVSEMGISVIDTINVQYGIKDSDLKNIDFTNVKWKNNSDITGLFTGTVLVSIGGGFSIEDNLIISSSDPLPCEVRALIPHLEKTGR